MDLIALAGGDTPLGREVRDLLSDAGLGKAVHLVGPAGGQSGVLTEVEGEPAFLTSLDATELQDADVIVCACDAAGTLEAWKLAGATPPPFIDMNGVLESDPGSRIRCPILAGESAEPGNPLVVAHSAATALALILMRVQKTFPIRHSVVQVLEPASERGTAAIHELQNQVTGLLSFRPYPKKIFDAQAAFNVLPRYGDDAPESLAVAEARLERHLATLLAGGAPMPSLRLIHAPVFHGHSFGIWMEFENRPSHGALEEALATAQIDVRAADLDPASNVGVAGQLGVTVGPVEQDRSHPRGMWLWAAADNYRLAAENAVALVRGVLEL